MAAFSDAYSVILNKLWFIGNIKNVPIFLFGILYSVGSASSLIYQITNTL